MYLVEDWIFSIIDPEAPILRQSLEIPTGFALGMTQGYDGCENPPGFLLSLRGAKRRGNLPTAPETPILHLSLEIPTGFALGITQGYDGCENPPGFLLSLRGAKRRGNLPTAPEAPILHLSLEIPAGFALGMTQGYDGCENPPGFLLSLRGCVAAVAISRLQTTYFLMVAYELLCVYPHKQIPHCFIHRCDQGSDQKSL